MAHYMADVLIGIFGYFPEGNRKFHYDAERVHKFFYRNKQLYSVLSGLMFDTNGHIPICKEIGQARSGLILNGLLQSRSVTSDLYEFPQGVQDLTMKFSGEQIEELKELSEKFHKEFSLEQAVSEPAN